MRSEPLAIDGGTAVLPPGTLPSTNDAAGRTFGPEEEEAVLRVLRSGMLSGVWGTEVKALEREFAEMMGAVHAVSCSSGTAALHLAVAAVDPAPGDEIIVPPVSDMGSVLPILAQNAVPVFADLDPETGCLDPADVRRRITPRTRAILVVHLFGGAAKLRELREIADAAGILLIEDCAQAYLARERPQEPLVGTVGHLGCFSLQQSKHITTGDGGLVLTDDPQLARAMRLFADKAWPRDTGERTYLSFALNYRMPELSGAVARAQLRKLPEVVARRRRSAEQVSARIGALAGVSTPPIGAEHSYWYYPLLVDGLDRAGARRVAAALSAEGVSCIAGYIARPLYTEPVLRAPSAYGGSGFPLRGTIEYPDGSCPQAEALIDHRLLVIPWNENFTDEQVDAISTAIEKVHRELITA
ncbi:MAG: DegT/DnrJ/EryC1/StrS family aminotransferase [Brachybacterium sp.]